MTQTWLSVAIKLPATFDPVYPVKFGYPGTAVRTLSQIEYVVNHSAEGGIAYLKQGQRPGEQASWMFSNALDGMLYQHFPLEAPTWTSGTPNANIHGVGVEHEGTHTANPKFTDAQADTDVRLFLELQGLCPNLGAPVHGQGVRIHKEVAPGTTSCPNDRDRYDKYALMGTEDDMALIVIYIAPQSSPSSWWIYDPLGQTRRPSTLGGFQATTGVGLPPPPAGEETPGFKVEYTHRILSDAEFNAITQV